MAHYHAAVWIDHREARVFHFSATEVDTMVVHPKDPHAHIHHKANEMGSGNAAEDEKFLHAVATALSDAGEILIVGPADEKNELVGHIKKHDPKVAEKIVGVETVDHPSDGQLIAYARKYFKSADRMMPS